MTNFRAQASSSVTKVGIQTQMAGGWRVIWARPVVLDQVDLLSVESPAIVVGTTCDILEAMGSIDWTMES